jgi:hypothetical protein
VEVPTITPDPALAAALQAVNYRVPIRQQWAGNVYVAYALPPEFSGLLHEAKPHSAKGSGRRFWHSPESVGHTTRFTPNDDVPGGTLLWVYIPHALPKPPADDLMILKLRPRRDWSRYPYAVAKVGPYREDAAA